ncbi:hypothetical protein [Streptomyces sp. Agncl-13]|uniref:hypothetical protein n=1 Tax=Streptomyces sp. Agncl-13 TaxID=3400628 RepID=UPI003A882233
MTGNSDGGGKGPGVSASVSVGGNNSGAINNLAAQRASHIKQSAETHSTDETPDPQKLLALFRDELDRNKAKLPNHATLSATADEAAGELEASEPEPGNLERIRATLAAAVTGTVVQKAGEALAHAIGGLLS